MTSIWDDLQALVKTSSSEFRVKSDKNVHVMDVGIAALKASDPKLDYSQKEKIHRLFRKEFFLSDSLDKAIAHARNPDNVDRSMFVEDPQFGDFIIGPSYSALRTRVTRALSKANPATSFTGVDDTGKTVTNIGHLSLKGQSNATTPLESKVSAIYSVVSNVPIVNSYVSRKLASLHKVHAADTSYTYNRKSFDINKFSEVLGEGTVLVTLQTAEKNNALAKLEARIEADLRKYLQSAAVHTKILTQKGSNSIVEDIIGLLVAKLTGKDFIPGSKHTNKPTKTSKTSLSGKSKVTVSRPVLRQPDGKFLSLNNLQMLLSANIVQKVKDNMGSGDRKDILNLRTGRLAESVSINRLSVSRQGMVTAFYSYMKNPYATFSTGGAMSQPASRDPKLLISKSIREIAAPHVSNRLRTVLV
jgi:hypothetical protein